MYYEAKKRKMYYEAKKMSSTLIQLTVQFFNETKRKNSIHHRDSELAGHVHNLDVKLQSL